MRVNELGKFIYGESPTLDTFASEQLYTLKLLSRKLTRNAGMRFNLITSSERCVQFVILSVTRKIRLRIRDGIRL